MTVSSTALRRAVKTGSASLVKFLLWTFASVNGRDRRGRTALHMACRSKQRDKQGIVEVLVRSGAEVNVRDKSGRTPLHEACENSNTNVVTTLMKNGAHIGVVQNNGWTPLHVILDMDMTNTTLSTFDALLGNLFVDSKETSSRHHEYGCILNAINLQDNNGNTALHLACEKNFTNIVCKLISAGANVELKNNKGMTALHWACKNRNKALVCLLLRVGARVGVENGEGMTALHFAGEACAADVVDVLVDSGGNVNAKDSRGNTPLHLACSPFNNIKSITSRGETINNLLNYGANLYEKNKRQRTPYQELDSYRVMKLEERWRIEETIIKHVVKIESTDLQARFDIKWKIDKEPNHSIISDRCFQELENMKNTTIVSGISAYSMLLQTNQPYPLPNDVLLLIDEILCSPDLMEKFPLYGDSLRAAFQRPKLLTLAEQSFYTETRKQMVKELPTNVVEHLLTYLSNEDLKSLIRSE